MRPLVLAAMFACQLPAPLTPDRVEGSTYKATADGLFGGWQGTAWVVSDGYLLTAGHMCQPHDTPAYFTLTGTTGRSLRAHPVAWEMTTGPEGDLCLLKAEGPVARPLVLADAMPEIGADVEFIGWPQGVFRDSHGVYQGGGASSTPCDHGASGSAMFSHRGVFGVLVQTKPEDLTGFRGCLATPLSEIRSFLNWAGVEPVNQPDVVE